MEFTLRIKIEATPEFCRAIDNLANTITSAFCVTADLQTEKAATPLPTVPPTPSPAPEPTGAATVSAPSATVAPANPASAPAAVPVATAPPAAAPLPTVPTAAQTYTQDQLALAASGLIDTGKLAELQQLLAAFNVDSLARLPKEQYGAFATKLREMGAKI